MRRGGRLGIEALASPRARMRASHWSIRTRADVALALREAAPRAELVVERDA